VLLEIFVNVALEGQVALQILLCVPAPDVCEIVALFQRDTPSASFRATCMMCDFKMTVMPFDIRVPLCSIGNHHLLSALNGSRPPFCSSCFSNSRRSYDCENGKRSIMTCHNSTPWPRQAGFDGFGGEEQIGRSQVKCLHKKANGSGTDPSSSA
jgi:hypothetical protein